MSAQITVFRENILKEELVAVFAWSNYHEIKTNILIKTKILIKLMNLSRKKFK